MGKYSKLINDMNKIKNKLINKAKKGGIYENFGQKEVRALKDKYSYNDMIYGDNDARLHAKLIDKLDDWAMSFNDNDISKLLKF